MENSTPRLFDLLRQLFKVEQPKVRRRRTHGCVWRIGPNDEGVSRDGDYDVVRIATTHR